MPPYPLRGFIKSTVGNQPPKGGLKRNADLESLLGDLGVKKWK